MREVQATVPLKACRSTRRALAPASWNGPWPCTVAQMADPPTTRFSMATAGCGSRAAAQSTRGNARKVSVRVLRKMICEVPAATTSRAADSAIRRREHGYGDGARVVRASRNGATRTTPMASPTHQTSHALSVPVPLTVKSLLPLGHVQAFGVQRQLTFVHVEN